MKNYSIRELERLSNVKAHTIRAWECRYGMLNPSRKNNIRYYSLEELKRLVRISYLHRIGYKLPYLVTLDERQLGEKVAGGLVTLEDRQEYIVNELIFSMQDKDPLMFDALLDQASLNWPLASVMEGMIFPFLLRTGLLWRGNLLTEEHFVVTAIRKKIMLAIETTKPKTEKQEVALLFLLTGQQLDLGLLYAHYIFKKSGWKVVNVGSGITYSNLKEFCSITDPDILFTYSTFDDPTQTIDICRQLGEKRPAARIISASYPSYRASSLAHENLMTLEYEQAIAVLSAGASLN